MTSRNQAKKIDVIVSTATSRNAATYLIVANSLQHYYPEAKKIVVVPDHDKAYFAALLPGWVEIRADSEVLSDQIIEAIRRRTPDRSGWYIQQFLKLGVLFSEAESSNLLMIWDGDTVQTRKITHSCGEFIYYATTDDMHVPYFDVIWKCLGLDKVVLESFVSQYIVLRSEWILELFEVLGRQCWSERLISTINFSEMSGFSEYELLGTFVKQRHPNRFLPNPKIRLLRYGNSSLGGIDSFKSLKARIIGCNPHLIAFEAWDPIEKRTLAQLLNRISSGSWIQKAAKAKWLIGRTISKIGNKQENVAENVEPFLQWLFSLKVSIRIVQVGANDGKQNDFLAKWRLVQLDGVRHLLIEPLPHYFALLKDAYGGRPDIELLNVAISKSRQQIGIYYIDPAVASRMDGKGPNNGWAHGQGSSSRAQVVMSIFQNSFRGRNFRHQIPQYISAIDKATLPCRPLSDVVEPEHICCLVIDVQGMELEVLDSIDEQVVPEFVIVEDEFSDNRILNYMMNIDYELIVDGHNKVFQYKDSRVRYSDEVEATKARSVFK